MSHLPEGNFLVAPTEDYLLFTLVQKGPEEKKEIYEFIDRTTASQDGATVRIWPVLM